MAELESEVFLLGNWKDFEELENNLSMPELTSVLKASRDKIHGDRKFFAAIQGIDLDEQEGKGQVEWENLKARVASRGETEDANDVLSLQGQRAKSLGFGIGMGLEAEKVSSDGTVTKLG